MIDTHIHWDDTRYEGDLDATIARARLAGVEAFVLPGAHPATLDQAVAIVEQYEEVYFAVGIHPYEIHTSSLETLHPYVEHPKCVAIGECGLDYFRLEGSIHEREVEKARQKELFRAHIRWAKALKKPLIVHIRDASEDAKTILLEENGAEVGGVLHCYNADETLLALAEHGFYFGIGGVVTFKNARRLVEILPRIPLDRLLLETDGPYLSPEPHRGQRNESAYLVPIVERMSTILGLRAEQIKEHTTRNARSLFHL